MTETTRGATEDTAVEAIAGEYWQRYLATNPTYAHLLGQYDRVGEFEDGTRAAEDDEIAWLRDLADRAEAVPESEHGDQDALTVQVLVQQARSRADLAETRLPEIAADPLFGPQVELPIAVGMLALPDADVAWAMADKLSGLARYYGELGHRFREGAARGRYPARFAVAETAEQIDTILAGPVAEDGLIPSAPLPEGIDETAWRARIEQVIADEVRPAMARYRDVLRDELLPHARSDERCGLSWLDNGEATYDATLRYYTTTDLTAREIHDLGLEQVARLADEYRSLGPEVVGTDVLEDIFEAMRSDPKLHFERGEQLIEASEVALARAWAAMDEWFEVLPQAPCSVQRTTTGGKAFYFPPAADGSRGGIFYINVDDPDSWGTFELESMTFHEGIPGHHLQLAISGELQGIPEFRKHVHNAAYAEGWGLYTERLADEMGLYSGPVDRMGMFAADSMRACRLVIDTGLHAFGWSRQQAVDYMVANSPLRAAMCEPEVDRYIVTPGQATSYMVGRIEIQRMRTEAEQRQGDAFDVRRFHSAVLDSGSVPLGVLDQVLRARLP